jgi:hypothetical protein
LSTVPIGEALIDPLLRFLVGAGLKRLVVWKTPVKDTSLVRLSKYFAQIKLNVTVLR